MIRFWILSNFGLVLSVVVILYIIIAVLLFKFIKTQTVSGFKRRLAKSFLIIFPIYVVAMWYTALVQEANLTRVKDTERSNMGKFCGLDEDREMSKKELPMKYPIYIINGYYQFGNRWLLEITPILASPIKILDNKECFQAVMRRLEDYDGKVKYIIYSGEDGYKDDKKVIFEMIKYKN